MNKIRLGKTNLMVSRTGFGALPIQRVNKETAAVILRKAYENGINFFDTAHSYTDSEEKIGYALSEVRKDIIIATKTPAKDRKSLLENLETSLERMKTGYIDIYQLHNPQALPDPEEMNGIYSALVEAKQKGLVRHIGITSHKLSLALEAAQSGMYDTVQYPLNYLSSEKDLKVIDACKAADVGVIAMKAMSGGLITNAAATFAFLRQYDNVVPIWGIQKENELDEFLALEAHPPELDGEMLAAIENDRKVLAGEFCRGCGYCQPCPVEIPISWAARMSLLLRRAPYQGFLTDEWKEQMERIDQCLDCGACKKRCPYELDTPGLLKKMLADYREFYAAHKGNL